MCDKKTQRIIAYRPMLRRSMDEGRARLIPLEQRAGSRSGSLPARRRVVEIEFPLASTWQALLEGLARRELSEATVERGRVLLQRRATSTETTLP